MNYFKLEYDVEKYENKGVIAYNHELYEIGMYDVSEGKIIDKWDNRITFNLKLEDGVYMTDYLWNDLGWLVVSSKFKESMEEMNITGIQYLPVNIIEEKKNAKLDGYYLANIHNLIEAVDMEQSEHFELSPGNYCFVTYAVKEDMVSNLDIFRLKEFSIPVFVSEKFKKTVKDNNLTGFSFTKIKVV